MTDPSPLTHVVAGCNKQVLHELRAATLYALHCVLHLKLILRSFPPPLPPQDFVSLVRASFRRVSAGPVRLPQQQQQLNHVCNPHVDSVSLQVQVLWCSTSQQARAATHWQRLCSKVRAMAARTRARDVAGLTVPPLAGLLARATVERIVNVKWNAGEYISNSVFVVILLTPFSLAACVPFIVAIFRSPNPPPTPSTTTSSPKTSNYSSFSNAFTTYCKYANRCCRSASAFCPNPLLTPRLQRGAVSAEGARLQVPPPSTSSPQNPV